MGKSSSAPAPDPALTAAQVHSLGIQDDAIQRMISMSEDLAPLQKQQLQQAIDQANQLWQQNADDRQYMLGRRDLLSGVQNTMVGEANAFNAQQQGEKLAGQATADVTQQFANAQDQAARGMQRMGVNPNDGRYAAMNSQNVASQGLATASAANAARTQAQQQKWALEDRASNSLAGYPSLSLQAQGQGVNTMGAGANAFNSGVNGLISPYANISGMAGQMGSNATGAYNAQVSASNAAAQQNAGLYGGVGAAIGGVALVI
jgi:hypothetical protein